MSDKQVSHYCKGFLGIAAVLIAVFIGLGVGAVVTWLTFVYVCSYVKLAITLIKYVPQVRKTKINQSTTFCWHQIEGCLYCDMI